LRGLVRILGFSNCFEFAFGHETPRSNENFSYETKAATNGFASCEFAISAILEK
jgi:hypothetical protein